MNLLSPKQVLSLTGWPVDGKSTIRIKPMHGLLTQLTLNENQFQIKGLCDYVFYRPMEFHGYINSYTLCHYCNGTVGPKVVYSEDMWDLFVEEHFPHLHLEKDKGRCPFTYLSEYAILRELIEPWSSGHFRIGVRTPTITSLLDYLSKNTEDILRPGRQIGIKREQKICWLEKSVFSEAASQDWVDGYLRVSRKSNEVLFNNAEDLYRRMEEIELLGTIVANSGRVIGDVFSGMPEPHQLDAHLGEDANLRLYNKTTVGEICFMSNISLSSIAALMKQRDLPILNMIYPVVADARSQTF